MTRAGRHAGVVVPLFSVRSAADWGIGELPDLTALAAWLAEAGQASCHLLPLLERSGGERSPYSALSAFAIDPLYVGLDAVDEFVLAGGRGGLAPADRDAIAALRAHAGIDYDGLRAVKRRGLEMAFSAFEARSDASTAARRTAFDAFRRSEAGWLDDYVVYRTLREAHGERAWTTWEPELHDPAAARAAVAGGALARTARFHAYVQWIAHEQLADARAGAAAHGVEVIGDLPFTCAVDSADVWARQGDFDVGRSVGAPPDAFNADGQDWALPAYRWDVIVEGGYAWLRARLEWAARWLDGVRLDHIVGYFRTYVRGAGAPPAFDPPDEAAQRELGARALDVLREVGRRIRVVVEDLGDIPPFVREAMRERDLPGYRVLRWEREGDRFTDPASFPPVSVATTGTHDTSTLAAWWSDELDDGARGWLAAVPAFEGLAGAGSAFTPEVHAALVGGLYAAGSATALLVAPDLFGERTRINTPATVGKHNWGYRMPLSVEALAGPAGRERAAWLRRLAERHGRVG